MKDKKRGEELSGPQTGQSTLLGLYFFRRGDYFWGRDYGFEKSPLLHKTKEKEPKGNADIKTFPALQEDDGGRVLRETARMTEKQPTIKEKGI